MDQPPLARLLGVGARAGEAVAHATGADAALDAAIEEAVVRALRSPGVERAIVRLVHQNAVQGALTEALTSDEIADAIIAAIESEAADKVWAEILASAKAQMLVERIAAAPEVRAAIAQQGAGLITDVGIRLTQVTEALDDAVERVLGGHRHDEETDQAGLATRLVAAAVDVGLAVVLFSLGSSVIASVIPFAFGNQLSLAGAIVLAVLAIGIGSTVVVSFWALAGQTPGMRFLSIRIEHEGEHRIGVRCAVRRWIGLLLALAPAGLGVVAIVRDGRRRGWHDRFAGTEVVYDSGRRQAPHSGGSAGPSARQRASDGSTRA